VNRCESLQVIPGMILESPDQKTRVLGLNRFFAVIS
jgi:hypothetical protein